LALLSAHDEANRKWANKMPLTDTALRKAKPAAGLVKLSDGGGLQLHLHPNGSKYWKLAYRYDGKQKKLAFGVYPEVSLAEARKRREAARALLRMARTRWWKGGWKSSRAQSQPETPSRRSPTSCLRR
jgi:hypothetical protein